MEAHSGGAFSVNAAIGPHPGEMGPPHPGMPSPNMPHPENKDHPTEQHRPTSTVVEAKQTWTPPPPAKVVPAAAITPTAGPNPVDTPNRFASMFAMGDTVTGAGAAPYDPSKDIQSNKTVPLAIGLSLGVAALLFVAAVVSIYVATKRKQQRTNTSGGSAVNLRKHDSLLWVDGVRVGKKKKEMI